MAKVNFFLAVALIGVVLANSLVQSELLPSISLKQVESFKEELEDQTKDNKITCENYKNVCGVGEKDDEDSVCQITLRSYLCDKLQSVQGVEEILKRVQKRHPNAINPAAGREFELEPIVESAELEDSDEYEDSGESPSIEYK